MSRVTEKGAAAPFCHHYDAPDQNGVFPIFFPLVFHCFWAKNAKTVEK